MAFTARTDDELRRAGYVPFGDGREARPGSRSVSWLRLMGVPIVQQGLVHRTLFEYWVPAWAVKLIDHWPLSVNVPEDEFALQRAIRFLTRQPDAAERVDEFLTVAALGGGDAIAAMLRPGQDSKEI